MGNIHTTSTSYPGSLDTASTLVDDAVPGDGSGTTIAAAHQNGPAGAILAIETELGIDPAGTQTDVVSRLNVGQLATGAPKVGSTGLAFTSGYIPFAKTTSGNVLLDQSTNLFWDDTNKQLQLSQTGSGAGLLIGGDAQLYRSAADTIRTPDSFTVDATLTAATFTANGVATFNNTTTLDGTTVLNNTTTAIHTGIAAPSVSTAGSGKTYFDSTANSYRVSENAGTFRFGLSFPIGGTIMWPATTVPALWLDCDGSAISRTTYADLFAVIGTTWGVGDGSTTFNLPDLRGRSIIGAGTGSGLTARTLAATGGAETHALSSAELAAHTHDLANHTHTGPSHTHDLGNHTHTGPSHTHTIAHTHTLNMGSGLAGSVVGAGSTPEAAQSTNASSAADSGASGTGATGAPSTNTSGAAGTGATGTPSSNTSSSVGSGTAHNNMQPFAVMKFIIRAL